MITNAKQLLVLCEITRTHCCSDMQTTQTHSSLPDVYPLVSDVRAVIWNT